MTKIKICGLTQTEDIMAVNEYLPDFIGFVFAPSKRQVTVELARALKAMLNRQIKAVGVFVNEPVENIAKLSNEGIIDLIQLHGDETQEYINSLKALTKKPTIKAVRVQSREQILKAQKLPCDMLLLDTYVNGQYGGSGETFERTLIPKLEKPFILAGGLNKENIAAAISECSPMCVDISSGAESNGKKDREKIKEIIDTVRDLSNGVI